MKLTILVSLALCAMTRAHMGMTLNNVKSRDQLKKGDNYRSPQGNQKCHGTARIGVQATVAAGASMKGKMSGGAAHGGGHCSMIVSVDEKKWYKIGDYKDCTTRGGLSFTMPKGVPKACGDAAGCTFGWLWTPMLSGTCEIYMNCYQFKVTGAMGGIEDQNSPTRAISVPINKCVRPNRGTKLTTMFGPYVGPTAADPFKEGTDPPATTTKAGQPTRPTTTLPNNAPITISPDDNSPKCQPGQLLLNTGLPATHKVASPNCGYTSEFEDAAEKQADELDRCKNANTLSKISELYDLRCSGEKCNKWQGIYDLNKCAAGQTQSCAGGADNPATCMSSPDLICVGQVLKLPQSECGESPCGQYGDWSPGRQECLCIAAYTGSQCHVKRAAIVGSGSVTETVTHSAVVLCVGVIASLLI